MEKKQKITMYIVNLSEQINNQYEGLLSKEKIQEAIEIYSNSEESYEIIINKINELAKNLIANYIEKQRKRYDPELIGKNHKEIYSKLEILAKKMNNYGLDYQLAGALCAYIKYGIESNRTHEDIDINLNEEDIDKFRKVCEEMGLQFKDNRLSSPRVLKNGIPSGEHEVIATLEGSEFHIGVFCFERKHDGTVISKGYYHDENNEPCSRNTIYQPELAKEIFGREKCMFRNIPLQITPPEHVYMLKSYTQNDKDKHDLKFMEDKIDKEKLQRIHRLSPKKRTKLVKIRELVDGYNFAGVKINNELSNPNNMSISKPKTLVRRQNTSNSGFVNAVILIIILITLCATGVIIGTALYNSTN